MLPAWVPPGCSRLEGWTELPVWQSLAGLRPVVESEGSGEERQLRLLLPAATSAVLRLLISLGQNVQSKPLPADLSLTHSA